MRFGIHAFAVLITIFVRGFYAPVERPKLKKIPERAGRRKPWPESKSKTIEPFLNQIQENLNYQPEEVIYPGTSN